MVTKIEVIKTVNKTVPCVDVELKADVGSFEVEVNSLYTCVEGKSCNGQSVRVMVWNDGRVNVQHASYIVNDEKIKIKNTRKPRVKKIK